jgi:hypothetical protein
MDQAAIYAFLDSIDKCHREIFERTSQCHLEKLSLPQFIGIAAKSRSRELVSTFRFAIEKNLPLVAPAIMRLQLDSALRLYALKLVDNCEDLARFIFEGEELRSYPLKTKSPRFFSSLSGDNKSLNDSFLYNQLSSVYSPSFRKQLELSPDLLEGHSDQQSTLLSPIRDSYQHGNKFVHLSQCHTHGQFELDSLQKFVESGDGLVLRSSESTPDFQSLSGECIEMLFVTTVLKSQIDELFPT